MEKQSREIFEKVCLTLNDFGFDIEKAIYPFPDFEKLDDIAIFKGLCRAIFSSQAVWESYERNFSRIDELLCNYDLKRIASFTDDDITRIYEQIKGLKVRDRFLRKKLGYFKENARLFMRISFHEFLRKGLSDKEGLIKKLINNNSEYKLCGVGLPICCEFFKSIGIDDFKPDVHMIYLFNKNRLGFLEIKDPKIPTISELYSVRRIGMDIAKAVNKPIYVVDNILWFFCAEGKAEICTTRAPKCQRCRLLNEKPAICKGNASVNKSHPGLENYITSPPSPPPAG